MSPKKGQKIKVNSKDFMLRTRLDVATLEKLDYSADAFNTSRSDIVRRGIEDEYSKALKNE